MNFNLEHGLAPYEHDGWELCEGQCGQHHAESGYGETAGAQFSLTLPLLGALLFFVALREAEKS